jgi:hydroxyacyl-ACP dehydratase HTD2-like protein with hotdog domain
MSVAIPAGFETIPPLVKEPTAMQLFLFSATTWNAHRIHYERPYAEAEGYPDVILQSHLHASFVAEAVMRAVGDRGRLVRLGWQIRGIAVPADTLTCRGHATGAEPVDGGIRVDYELEERNQRDELCLAAWASVLVQDGSG